MKLSDQVFNSVLESLQNRLDKLDDPDAPFRLVWEREVLPRTTYTPPPTPPAVVAAQHAVNLTCPNIERYSEADDAARDWRAYRERATGEVRTLPARDIACWGAPVAWLLAGPS